MENHYLNIINENEDLMGEFITKFGEQFNSDDEPYSKKFRRLYMDYIYNPELVDNVLMTLCGWKMETLAEMTINDTECDVDEYTEETIVIEEENDY